MTRQRWKQGYRLFKFLMVGALYGAAAGAVFAFPFLFVDFPGLIGLGIGAEYGLPAGALAGILFVLDKDRNYWRLIGGLVGTVPPTILTLQLSSPFNGSSLLMGLVTGGGLMPVAGGFIGYWVAAAIRQQFESARPMLPLIRWLKSSGAG